MLGINKDNIPQSELSEVTYFVCLKHLSETIGKLPLKLYQNTEKGKVRKANYLEYLLNYEPNPYYTANTLWQSVELNKNHFGNAYIYVETKKGKVKNLWLLPSENVEVWIDNEGIFKQNNALWYIYTTTLGKKYKFNKDEIIHIKTSVSLDGVTGIPVRDILQQQIQISQNGQAYLNKMYKNNMFGGKVFLHYTGDLNNNMERQLAEKIENYSTSLGTGKIIPLPLGIQAEKLDMKLTDVEFTSLNKLNALQIASAFGIKPNILNDYSKSSYSNSETQQLDFYVNSLLPILRQYEQELTRKLLTTEEKYNLKFFEFNPNIIFRTDFKTQVESLSKAVNNFILYPNEARDKLGLEWVEGGDELIGNGNYIKLNQVGTQWSKGGENNSKEQE
ncbi:phage portal protein [Clostridium botulinum C/D]|nr:phage portal protein [Clostridium botulinum C/D]MCD3296295.1 phage portal protein [Clostridium botulinum C/D]